METISCFLSSKETMQMCQLIIAILTFFIVSGEAGQNQANSNFANLSGPRIRSSKPILKYHKPPFLPILYPFYSGQDEGIRQAGFQWNWTLVNEKIHLETDQNEDGSVGFDESRKWTIIAKSSVSLVRCRFQKMLEINQSLYL